MQLHNVRIYILEQYSQILIRFCVALANEVAIVEPSRLITLLEDCVKWQQHQGLLPLDAEFDLFRGSDEVQETEDDAFANNNYKNIKVW